MYRRAVARPKGESCATRREFFDAMAQERSCSCGTWMLWHRGAIVVAEEANKPWLAECFGCWLPTWYWRIYIHFITPEISVRVCSLKSNP